MSLSDHRCQDWSQYVRLMYGTGMGGRGNRLWHKRTSAIYSIFSTYTIVHWALGFLNQANSGVRRV